MLNPSRFPSISIAGKQKYGLHKSPPHPRKKDWGLGSGDWGKIPDSPQPPHPIRLSPTGYTPL
ncbi:hypothetical protein [Kamptonema formosum]|uniref:hypothetical protein n=1 Tax=Kamptonema formosum TaxID=331992 RepID=UPI00034D7B24|nr:hypothetical protein [Oscillatoria sp. PCC 10802]